MLPAQRSLPFLFLHRLSTIQEHIKESFPLEKNMPLKDNTNITFSKWREALRQIILPMKEDSPHLLRSSIEFLSSERQSSECVLIFHLLLMIKLGIFFLITKCQNYTFNYFFKMFLTEMLSNVHLRPVFVSEFMQCRTKILSFEESCINLNDN